MQFEMKAFVFYVLRFGRLEHGGIHRKVNFKKGHFVGTLRCLLSERRTKHQNISKNGGEIGLGYNSYRGRPREMHKITCSDCGKEAEVPFAPTEGKPVYCRDCYQKHKRY